MKASNIKDFYNNTMPGKFEHDYEHGRWFKTPLLRASYEMTKMAIEKHVLSKKKKYSHALEVGAGPGTWSKLLLRSGVVEKLDIVDISSEMLTLAKHTLSDQGAVSFFESDFIAFSSSVKYDFFFSSRALEYFPDKEKFVEQMQRLLRSGGEGFIITKNPHYLRSRLLRKKISEMHTGQISPRALKKILGAKGFGDVKIYPVAMSFPIFHSPFVNVSLYRVLGRFPLNFISNIFAESYCIAFSKK